MTTPAQDAAPRSPRGFFSSQARIVAWALLAAVLLGLGSVPWFLSDPARMTRLVARAVPELQGDVTFGRVSIGWTGPIVLEDVQIVPWKAGTSGGPGAGRNPIRIGRIEGSHGLAGMLLSLGDVGRLRIEGLEADVVFTADRDSNLKGLFLPPDADAANTSRGKAPRRSAVRMRLEVEDAIVRIEGPWSAEAWVSDPIDVRATLADAAEGPHSEWLIEPVQLLKDARLEPGVAQGVLAYIAPVLADAARTAGRFSLRIDGARLPVGQPASGTLAGMLSMHSVDLGPGPMAKNIIDSLPGRLQPPQSIRIADDSNIEFLLQDRRVWHKGLEFGLPLAKPGQRLDIESSGSVGIDDRSLDLKLALPIPADLPQDRPLLAALGGKTFSVGVGGVLGEPKMKFDGSLRTTAGEVVVDLIDRLRNGPVNRPAPAPSPTGSPIPVPVPQLRPAGPPEPGWKPEPAAGGVVEAGVTAGPPKNEPKKDDNAAVPGGDKAGDAPSDTAQKLEQLKSKLPPEIGKDPSADAVIDLVGGVLEGIAKRRAERQAAEAANPQQPSSAAPPRRGRLLRRLASPPAAPAAPTENP